MLRFMTMLSSLLLFLFLMISSFRARAHIDVVADLSGNYSDIYFRRLPRQIDVGSEVKVTLSLGLPRTIFSLLLACNRTHYDFQLDVNFRANQIVLSSASGERGIKRGKKERSPIPPQIKSLRTKDFSVYLRALRDGFIVGLVDERGDGVETHYSNVFSLCNARYILLHGSRDIHSIKIGGVPMVPIVETDGNLVASILDAAFVNSQVNTRRAKDAAVKCRLSPPLHGFAASSGSLAVFGCEKDYMLSGSMARHCQSNGEWSGHQPTCRVRSCSIPPYPPLERGRVDVYGRYAAYQCNEGFALVGASVRQCLDDGTWSVATAFCSVPAFIVSGPRVGRSLLGRDVEFRCDAFGYPLPEISWLRFGVRIVSNRRISIQSRGTESILLIRNVTFYDYGPYACLAENSGGKDTATAPLVDDGKCSMHSENSHANFTCANGVCIYFGRRCDGVDDCGDFSDELGCIAAKEAKQGCSEDKFACEKTPKCIPKEWVCNGAQDCSESDLSDEYNCDFFNYLTYPGDISLALTSPFGSFILLLACSAEEYPLVVEIDFETGDVLLESKKTDQWQAKEFLTSVAQKSGKFSLKIRSNMRGFVISLQGRDFQYENSSCKVENIGFGGESKIKDISAQSGPLHFLPSNFVKTSLKTDLQQIRGGASTSRCKPIQTPRLGTQEIPRVTRDSGGAKSIFACPPAFLLAGSSARVCKRGIWSGKRARCNLAPVVRSIDENNDVGVALGASVRFVCFFAGDPLPFVTWNFDGAAIVSGERATIFYEGLRSSLLVENVGERDFGRYECQARNSLGVSSKTFQIRKLGSCGLPPPLPANALLVRSTSDEVRYECKQLFLLADGDLRRQCEKDGKWSGKTPTCIPICGMSSVNRRRRGKRIIGGKDVIDGAWPWQVLLEQSNGDLWCGGSLISLDTVITAAHCVEKNDEGSFSPLIVRLGAHSRRPPSLHEQVVPIRDAVIHPHYDPTTYDNDIALLHLSRPVRINSHVMPVCLPEAGILFAHGTPGFISGWGKTNESSEKYPNVLQQAKIRIVSNSICNAKISHNGDVSDSMTCAGLEEGGRDACDADSGGPLVVKKDGKKGAFVLAGITSWGSGCGRKYKYGVYTRVPKFIEWIKRNIP